jgi:hypothetical protein
MRKTNSGIVCTRHGLTGSTSDDAPCSARCVSFLPSVSAVTSVANDFALDSLRSPNGSRQELSLLAQCQNMHAGAMAPRRVRRQDQGSTR